MKTILCISPHTDDSELGAGGTIAKMLGEGHSVHVYALSRCEHSLPEPYHRLTLEREMHGAMKSLGVPPQHTSVMDYRVRTFPERRQDILEQMVSLRQQIKPDLVICTAPSDIHQDHETVAREAMRAFRCSVWGSILPWNTLASDARCFVELTEAHVEKKANALMAYESQQALHRPYMCAETIWAWARTVGLQVGCEYAEAFEIIRQIA